MLLARNKEFWPCWVIIPVLCFSQALHCLGLFLDWGMGMRNKAYHVSGILLVSAAVNIGLNIVFIPYWGIMGAAFASLISYIVWNCLKIYYSAKFYDLHFDLTRLLHITTVGVSLYLFSLFISNTVSLPLNILIKFIILFAFPIFFFFTKFFTPKEKEYIQRFWVSLREKRYSKNLYQNKGDIKPAKLSMKKNINKCFNFNNKLFPYIHFYRVCV